MYCKIFHSILLSLLLVNFAQEVFACESGKKKNVKKVLQRFQNTILGYETASRTPTVLFLYVDFLKFRGINIQKRVCRGTRLQGEKKMI